MSGPFESALRALMEGAEDGTFELSEVLVSRARPIAPHRDGVLERSITAIVNGLDAVVIADTPYAVAQHENEGYRHEAGRQDHYLSEPAEDLDQTGEAEQIVGVAMKRRLDRG